MAQLKNREKALNLNFGIPISMADALQDLPATGNVQQYDDSDLNLVMSTAMLSGPDSGLTTNNNFTNWRKRGRESGDSFAPVRENPPLIMPSSSAAGTRLSILGDDVAAPIHQPQQQIEQFIALQIEPCELFTEPIGRAVRTERVRSDLEKTQKRQSKRLMAVLERTIVKKLKQKEAEIDNIGKVNCALKERVRSLCIDNQIWQNLARSNEATANALRSNLEQVLAQANEGHGDSKEDACAAESCCCNKNNNNKSAEEEDDHLSANGEWRCRNCEESTSSVLLLPCRHLCLCSGCAAALGTCPICKSTKTATVQVYLS